MEESFPTMHSKLREVILREAFTDDMPRVAKNHLSPDDWWLFDIRKIVLVPEYLALITEVLWQKIESRYPFQLGGLESASIPLITGLVMKSIEKGKPVNGFYIRKERKEHDKANAIEGTLTDKKIILVDDLINGGGSIEKQLLLLTELGHTIDAVLALVQFRPREHYDFLNDASVELLSLFPLPDLGYLYLEKRKEKDFTKHFKRLWYFGSPTPTHTLVTHKSSPTIDEKKIYFGSDNGTFWALNQNDGSVAWKYSIGILNSDGKNILSSPGLHNNTVFFGAYDGNVYALDTNTGTKKWVYRGADWIGSSPYVSPELNLVCVGLEFGLFNKHGGVAALNIETGDAVWEFIAPALTHSSPLVIPETHSVVVGSNDNTVYCLNAKDGSLIWKLITDDHIKMSFAYDAPTNTIVFGSMDARIYFVDADTGFVRHTFLTGDGIYSTPIIDERMVYVSSLDKQLYAFDLDTHELCWSFKTNGRLFAEATIVENAVYVGSCDGKLYELDKRTGEMNCFHRVTERITNPIAYNAASGTLFLPTYANELYALKRTDIDRISG